MQLIEVDAPPPLTDRDTVERTDPEWREAAERFVVAKRAATAAAAELGRREEGAHRAHHAPERTGCGVSVTRLLEDRGRSTTSRSRSSAASTWRASAVLPREEIRVTVSK